MENSEDNQIKVPVQDSNSTEKGNQRSKPERRPLSIWRRLFRIFILMLIIFGLGALSIIFILFIPIREQLFSAETRIEQLSQQSRTELEVAQEEIDRLSSVEEELGHTQSELDKLALQNLFLQTRLDIISAKLALVSETPDLAVEVLSSTGSRIANIKRLAGPDQQKNAENLETRLKLVLEEIDDSTFAAISDLEVMIEILDDMET